MLKGSVKNWGVLSSMQHIFVALVFHTATAFSLVVADDVCIRSQAWSVTQNADGTAKFNPEICGVEIDQLREFSPSFFFNLVPSSLSLTENPI